MIDILLGATQWPAMAATLAAGWLVASQNKERRNLGFWIFILSNLLWIVWGCYAGAYALIAMQIGLFFLNVRGTRNNDNESTSRR